MSTTDASGLSFGDHQPTWDDLAQRVDALLAAWEAGAPPALAAFLPAEPGPRRQLVLVELIKVDLEQRIAHGLPLKRVEEYVAEFPELAVGGLPCDLLYEEYHLRRRQGEDV